MGRLVSPQPAAAADLQVASASSAPAAGASASAKGWMERVAKYVPSEVVAAYLALVGFIPGAPADARSGLAIGTFVLCWILTPIYLNGMAPADHPKMKHIGVSTIAFPVWAYAAGGDNGIFGPLALNWYNVAIASMILVAFSAISGAFVPKHGEK